MKASLDQPTAADDGTDRSFGSCFMGQKGISQPLASSRGILPGKTKKKPNPIVSAGSSPFPRWRPDFHVILSTSRLPIRCQPRFEPRLVGSGQQRCIRNLNGESESRFTVR